MRKRRRLRWGKTFVAIAARFSGPRLLRLREYCHEVMNEAPDFREMHEKDFACGRHAFEEYGHTFLLWLDHPADEWVLDVVHAPKPPPRRRPPANTQNEPSQRAMVAAAAMRPPKRSRLKRILFISYKKARGSSICRTLAAFWSDASGRRGPESVMLAVNAFLRALHAVQALLRRRYARPLSTSVVEMYNRFAESLRGDAGTILVRKQYGGNIGVSLILSTYAPNGMGMHGASSGELWPISLFGEPDDGRTA